ncbi:LOW QUALITY PROTEIN: hypothetical protein BC938DRAFT_471947 [Jimgerdemannia flammicorona]|uniref:Uncharacterized protein n=1 Tax=Jimgerdemannia flammicorona TaxID=994334 RepID=A0A433Q716_9FUNG|nr:LOW QUALITY PROTEIN: hypothetical protein BC938DRAFT_471947 [Jimgerdemannia flammicorona]
MWEIKSYDNTREHNHARIHHRRSSFAHTPHTKTPRPIAQSNPISSTLTSRSSRICSDKPPIPAKLTLPGSSSDML